MTSNIVLKCSGNANKDAVAAILRALLPAEMRRRICAKCLKGHKKSRAWRGEIKIEGNGRNGIFENPAALCGTIEGLWNPLTSWTFRPYKC